jgi:hypothetical protein
LQAINNNFATLHLLKYFKKINKNSSGGCFKPSLFLLLLPPQNSVFIASSSPTKYFPKIISTKWRRFYLSLSFLLVSFPPLSLSNNLSSRLHPLCISKITGLYFNPFS